MTLSRAKAEARWRIIADWPAGKLPGFVESPAYDVLRGELGRYLDGTVRGRSFLIAGHRGAGKTSMVRQAVDEAYLDILKTAETLSAAAGRAQRQAQRPLLVLLHGPSLLGAGVPEAGKPAASTPDAALAASSGAIPVTVTVAVAGTAPAAPPVVAALAPADALVEAALPQIMIALYRALASQAANAYANHARLAPAPHQTELLEIAAQLRLDLDMEPDQALLRDRWARIGGLINGVLWPPALGAYGPADQGVREIAALATAAQAFQACVGKVEMERSAAERSTREATMEASGRLAAREIGNTLAAMLAGVAVGASVSVTAGAAAALMSLVGLRWTAKRSRLSERGYVYRFLPDRSVQTLDRDLPLVIDRLRDIGLAPVFVIDELDKLPPDTAEQQLGALIARLKQFTTDYGFFCFLVDRPYFDAIQARIATMPYAPEHTFFSHRLFIHYSPEAMGRYVLDGIAVSGDLDDAAARIILAKVILHTTELNFMNVVRELARLLDSPGAVPPSGEIASRQEYRLTAVVQMAIEHIMRQPILRARITENAAFAQLAIDTLYRISRSWRAGAPDIGRDEDDIIEYLSARLQAQSGPAPGIGTGAARKQLLRHVSSPDLAVLLSASRELGALLSNFDLLATKLRADESLPAEDRDIVSLLNAMPGQCLIAGASGRRPPEAAPDDSVPESDGSGQGLTYRFMLDRFGMSEAERNTIVPGEQIPGDLAVEAGALVDLIQAFADALPRFDVKPADLIAVGVLARTTAWGEVERACKAVAATVRSDVATGTLLADVQRLRGARGQIEARAAVLRRLLPLAAYVRHHARPGANWNDTPSIMAKMDRLLMLETILPDALDGLLGQADAAIVPHDSNEDVFATGSDIRAWLDKVPSLPAQTDGVVTITKRVLSSWLHWEFDLRYKAVAGSASGALDIQLNDVILDAAGEPPGRLLVRQWPLPPWSWSELALEGALTAAQSENKDAQGNALGWALLAGLRAQGFDRERLLQLRADAGHLDPNDLMTERLNRLVEGAVDAAPGTLCIVKNKFEPGDVPTPCVILEEADIKRYGSAIKWLQDHRVVEGLSRGRTS